MTSTEEIDKFIDSIKDEETRTKVAELICVTLIKRLYELKKEEMEVAEDDREAVL